MGGAAADDPSEALGGKGDVAALLAELQREQVGVRGNESF
jgi:hypothetical protein